MLVKSSCVKTSVINYNEYQVHDKAVGFIGIGNRAMVTRKQKSATLKI